MIKEKTLADKIKTYLDEKGIKVIWLSRKTRLNWSNRLSGRTKIKAEDLDLAVKALNIPINTFL